MSTTPLTNTIEAWIHTPVARTLGLTLAHFVWEGLAIAALAAIALWIARGASSRVRYALACAALVALPLVFAITFAILLPHAGSAGTIPLAPVDLSSDSAPIPIPTPASWRWIDALPWAAPSWMLGVFCLLTFRLASWITAERLRRRGTFAVPQEWSRRFAALAERAEIARTVRLIESALADVPMMMGYFKPVVLLPMGMLAGLPADQVEAILLHELAHIRRADYLVNLVQSAIESLLFYHPAVWWISNVVRAEREHCCDDFVIASETNPATYASALLALEHARGGHAMPALAANDGDLVRRVRRMLRKPSRNETQPAILPAVLACAIVSVAGVAFAAWQPDTIAAHTQKSTDDAITLPSPDRGTRAGTFVDRGIERPSATRKSGMLLAQAQQSTQGGRGARGGAAQPSPNVDDPSQSATDRLRGTYSRFVQGAGTTINDPYSRWLREDVAYLITKAERDQFIALTTDEQREQFIKDFWDHRNPVPGSATNQFREEHYRRIAYANTRFKWAIPGWKTDRGRIYITYGPPDEIESHPSGGAYQRPAEQGGGTVNTAPFEMWRYRFIDGIGQNVILEFVDKDSNGEYHLTSDPHEKDATAFIQFNNQVGPTTDWKSLTALQVVQGVAVDPNHGVGNKHAGVFISSGGNVSFVVPLEGSGPFHLTGRVTNADGQVVAAFEDKANSIQLNYVGKFTLKPGSYAFTVTRNSDSEVVNFAVK